MASKNKILDLFLAKGEKIAIFSAAGLLGALLLWGAITAVGGDSPSKTATDLKQNADRVQRATQAEDKMPPEVEERYRTGQLAAVVPYEEFPSRGKLFEPTIEPSKLKDLPKVLTPEGYAQIDLIKGPMPAFDILDDGKGGVQIGILTTKTIDKNQASSIKDIKGRLGKNSQLRPGSASASSPQPPGGGPRGGAGGPGTSAPGTGGPLGGGGFGGAQGGGPLGGAGPGGGGAGQGSPDGGGGGPRGGMGGMAGMGGEPNGPRTETAVSYVSLDDFNKSNNPPALAVYPLRMAMVQAAFPLKKQFEEIRKALKVASLSEAIQFTGYAPQGGKPLFDGLVVERRIVTPREAYPWMPFDHEVYYFNEIHRRKLESAPENGWTAYFTRYDQKLAVPLPRLTDSLVTYPPINLEPIAKAAKKLKDENRPQITYSEQSRRFQGANAGNVGDIYNTGGFGGAGGLFPGMGGPGEDTAGPGIGGGPRGGGPRGMGGGGMMPGTGGPGGAGIAPSSGGPGSGSMLPGTGSPDGGGPGFGRGGVQPPTTTPGQAPKYDPSKAQNVNDFYPLLEEYLLVRFVDPTVRPGEIYEYRLKIKLKNPLFGLPKNQVSQSSFAQKEVLESGWYTISQQIPVPPEAYVYALDPVEYEKGVKEKYPKDNGMQGLLKVTDGRQAVVQIHRWMERARLGDKQEPVGAWVIGEVQTSPGEYIGRKHLVQLPTWSAEKGYYLLKELPEGLRIKNSTQKDPPKGWLLDLSTDNILVDFDGGRFRGQVGDKTVQDESAEELLILKSDGTMMVRNSEYDRSFKMRDLRSKAWDEWVKQAEKMTPGMGQGFNRDRDPGSGSGPGAGGGPGGRGE